MTYKPGTHIIAALASTETHLLEKYASLRIFVDKLINTYELVNLGEVYHNFEPQGFTAVICLSESHMSFHTWPEYGRVNMDIYLSNYLRTNDETVMKMFLAIVDFFSATVISQQTLTR